MSASTERASGGLFQAAVRPAGLIWLALCMAALAGGFWPQIVYMPKGASPYSVLPALQMVAVAHAIWAVGVYPVVLQRRLIAGDPGRWWLNSAVETVWLIAVAGPIYLTAAWVADAVFEDVIRMILYSICLWPFSLAMGGLLTIKSLRGPAMLAMLVILAGLPAAAYMLAEFYRSTGMETVLKISPAIFAWTNAGSRTAGLLPAPAWVAAAWPLAGAAIILAGSVFTPRRSG